MTRVLFLVRRLDYGGTERQICLLASGLARRGHEIAVAVFYAGGELESELQGSGVKVLPLHKRGRWESVNFLRRLRATLRSFAPDVLHTYLGVTNVLGALIRGRSRAYRLVWGVRNAGMRFERYDRIRQLAERLETRLVGRCDLVICNSWAGRDHKLRRGFCHRKTLVVPNGIDTQVFQRSNQARERLRSEWNMRDDSIVIGLVGRLDPVKGHPIFLEAAARIAAEFPETQFVCVGGGSAAYREELSALASRLGIMQRLCWFPPQQDVATIYSALDILCSASIAESFPNVIGEAMACELPSVVTDVGDCARIVGDTGLVAPPDTCRGLASALRSMLELKPAERDAMGERARRRIQENFSVERMIESTEALLHGLIP